MTSRGDCKAMMMEKMKTINALLSMIGPHEILDLQSWRDWFSRKATLLVILFFPIAFFPSVFVYITQGKHFLVAIDLGFWLFLIFRFFLVPQSSYHINTVLWLALIYTLTATYYVDLGPHYARSGWLVMCAVISTLHYGVRGAVVATTVNAGMLILLYWLIPPQNPAWSAVFNAPLSQWVMFVMNISLITLIACLPVGFLLHWLDHSLKQKLESETKYRMLAENAADVIWTFSLESMRYPYVSPSVLQLLGYTPHEAMELTIEQTLSPESTEQTMKILQEELARETEEGIDLKRSRTLEMQVLKKDGTSLWTEMTLSFIRNAEGKPVGILGVTRDIAERKRAEEEKTKMQGYLLQSQKMEAVGKLAGGVAHDFNNMLGVILGHAEIAIAQTDPAKPLHAALQEIRKAAERSSDLTRQLLGFARQQTITPKVLNMNETVANMLKMLQRLIGEDIDLKWQSKANLWSIRADPSQIDQILANLCVNARDAIMRVGKVTIETVNTNLDEAYCADHEGLVPGDYVLLTVSDDGCGMDKETMDKIFEPFFTTKGVGKGTGLGLAMVYGIVKQNNGFIQVYSEPGQGTTFKIYLPRYIGETDEVKTEELPEPPKGGQETVLVVEDEPALLDLNKLLLEAQGYRVLSASTPNEALRLAEECTEGIHLLMTDVVMPEMNGRELAEKLLSLYPRLKCLFTSGYTAEIIAHHGVLDKGVYFIQKPFSRRDLAAKVREVLDQK